MSSRSEEILSVAEGLTQVHGFNGFSYNDISTMIGIKTSSIHYHFKTKDDLATALIKRYLQNFKLQLKSIDSACVTPEEQLIKFSEIFKKLANTNDKFCLCGMMAAEVATLSEESNKELVTYFQSCVEWLSKVFLQNGSKSPDVDAEAYLSLLEGALLIARVKRQPEMIDQVVNSFRDKFPKM